MLKRLTLFAFAFNLLIIPAIGVQAASQPREVIASQNTSPSSLVILFSAGSSKLERDDKATLDRASRAYNEGKPIVMIITGSADRSGNAVKNLKLSQQRANAVLRGLLDRGIPADRFQVLAKGETELAVPTPHGTAEPENRRVVISWH